MNSFIKITPELIEDCKSGNQYAYNQVYYGCAKGVFNSIIRIVNHREEAEDILQETFISAFKNIENFRNESSLFGWIKKIAINKSLNSLKKKQLQWSETSIENLNIEEEEDEWDHVKLSVNEIAQQLNNLPNGYRLIISLYLFEGYSHKEIAQELGISESTSRTQYVRGKKKLRALLNTVAL
ncbi:MAG: RNA polymerase sigma factor [Flavobacteriales bacterium]|nr:RNA polymerase sigma factor [Flavobacteriales bacterium]